MALEDCDIDSAFVELNGVKVRFLTGSFYPNGKTRMALLIETDTVLTVGKNPIVLPCGITVNAVLDKETPVPAGSELVVHGYIAGVEVADGSNT